MSQTRSEDEDSCQENPELIKFLELRWAKKNISEDTLKQNSPLKEDENKFEGKFTVPNIEDLIELISEMKDLIAKYNSDADERELRFFQEINIRKNKQPEEDF